MGYFFKFIAFVYINNREPEISGGLLIDSELDCPPCGGCVEICVKEGNNPPTCKPSGKFLCTWGNVGACVSYSSQCGCPIPCDTCTQECEGGTCVPNGNKYCPDGSCRGRRDTCQPCDPPCNRCNEMCRNGVCVHTFGPGPCPEGTAQAGACVPLEDCDDICDPPCDGCVKVCINGVCVGNDDRRDSERCPDGRCIPEWDSCYGSGGSGGFPSSQPVR